MLDLKWNDVDGHYELVDNDEFLMAIAKVDIKDIMGLLTATEEGNLFMVDWARNEGI